MARPRVIRGRKLYGLLRELAENELSQAKLAEKYGCSQGRVSQLKTEYADEIADMADDLEDLYRGLWIARKEERIAGYIRLAEALEADMEENGLDSSLCRQYIACLKAVAEEMGQLPSRVVIRHEGPKADYTVEGVNPKDFT